MSTHQTSEQRVYAIDKQCAELCREMSIVGFGFDASAAARAAEALRELEAQKRREADDAVGRHIESGKGGGFSTKDLQRAFFRDLGAPVFFRSTLTGQPSLGKDALRGYAALPDERLRALALAVIEYRNIRIVRRTFVEGISPGADGRVHPSWLNYGTVSGRWACQDPNLMNQPRPEKDPLTRLSGFPGGVRGLYVAAPKHVLVAFDCKQLEMRIAAYASGDEAMIRACEGSDLHSANAEIIFGSAFSAREYAELDALGDGCSPEQRARRQTLKALRTLAKTSGFAVCYLAEAPTVYARLVAEGQTHLKLDTVKAMLSRMRRAFAGYYAWQDKRLHDCIRTGYTTSPIIGRKRYLGHEPAPTECANFPIQSGAADFMNVRLLQLVADLAARKLRARLVAQVHDSAVFEVHERDAAAVVERAHSIYEAPITIASSGRPLDARFPIDSEVSERWH